MATMTSASFGNGNGGGGVKKPNILSKKSTVATVLGGVMLMAMFVALLRHPWRPASTVVNSATSDAAGARAPGDAARSANDVNAMRLDASLNVSDARCCSTPPCFDCSSVLALIDQVRDLPAFGRGFYKQAHLVQVGERTFVLKSLHDTSAEYLGERYFAKNGRALSDDQLQQRLVDKFASECHQMLDWHRQLAVSIVPHVHGGCHRVGAPVVTVVERLRTLTDVTFDAAVPISSRVALAISTMRLVAEWDRLQPFNHSRADTDVISSLKDYRVENATALIYGDFDPKQFAVDEGLQLKLVDIDAREWVPYAPLTSGNFGSQLVCSTDDDCTAYTMQFGIDRRLEKGKRPLPLDFSCNTTTQRCVGLSSKTNVFAACAILLTPLLETFYTYTKTDDPRWELRINNLLARCTAHDPSIRPSAVSMERAFRDLLIESPTPALRLTLEPLLSGESLEDSIVNIRKSIKKQRVLSVRTPESSRR